MTTMTTTTNKLSKMDDNELLEKIILYIVDRKGKIEEDELLSRTQYIYKEIKSGKWDNHNDEKTVL
jgi:hypothetical protein